MGNALHRKEFGGSADDVETTSHARRLLQVASEILALADELDGETGRNGQLPEGLTGKLAPERKDLAALARETYRARRCRAQHFEGLDLFGEPAWDLLLDLFIAACEGKTMPVTSACIGAAVPTTTALRWLTVLENRGLVEREADDSDARRVFVRLTPRADEAMTAYFAHMGTGQRGDEPRLPFMLRK